MKKLKKLLLGIFMTLTLASCDINSMLGNFSFPDLDEIMSNGSQKQSADNSKSQKESTHQHRWQMKTVITPPTCYSEGEDLYECASCGETTIKITAKTDDHDFVIESTIRPSTCTQSGTARGKCSKCGEIRNITTPATGHDYSNTTEIAADSLHTPYTYATCTTHLNQRFVMWDSLSYVELNGTFKGNGPDGTFKFANNGDYLRYNLSIDGLINGKIYLLGSMDQWGEDSYYLDYTMTSTKNHTDNPNFQMKINGTPIEISLAQRNKPYGELIPTRTTDERRNSELFWIEIGEIVLYGEENVIEYQRLDSYNLSIKAFKVVGSDR